MTRKSKVLDSQLPRRVTWVNHLKLPQLQLPFSPKWAALNLLPLKKKLRGLKTYGRQGLHTVGSGPLSNDYIMNLVYTLRVTAMNACPRRTLRYVYFLLV